MSVRVAVIGGGVSGLTAAYRLHRELGNDARITVYESAATLGGKVRTATLAGRPFDVGAEAFLARRPEALDLARELDLGNELTNPTGARSRILAGGSLHGLPTRTMMGIPAEPDAAAGVLSGPGARAAAAECELPPPRLPDHDVSLGGLLRERFGPEVVERLVDPMLGGVYSGGSDQLGLRATMPGLAAALDDGAGSVTAAAATLLPDSPSAAPVFATLTGGLATLVQRLADRGATEIRTRTTVRALTRSTDGRWRLTLGAAAPEHAPADSEHEADAIVLAAPASAAARLLSGPAPGAAEAFGAIEPASMGVVSIALPETAHLPDLSGILIGVGERRANGTPFAAKAFTFSTRKWGHLVGEEAAVLVRGSVGRFGEPGVLRLTDAEVIRQVCSDFAELTGRTVEPIEAFVTRWGGGLPQYGVGHLERVARIEQDVARLPTLEVAGASLYGVGIPACIGTADAAAHRLAGVLAPG